MGEDVDSLDTFIRRKQHRKLATHVLQLTFSGFSGFRWPVAYFGTSTANAYQIHSIFWQAVDILGQYGFVVDYCNLDGAATNRAFLKMLISQEQQLANDFSVTDSYDPNHEIIIMQDIKHVLKKIRNSILSSRIANKNKTDIVSSRYILLDDKPIVWDTFELAAKFNIKFRIRIHHKLSNDAIYLTSTNKMRNALAEQVLGKDMLNLLKAYMDSINPDRPCAHDLSGMITLLEHTSKLVDIFHDMRPITTTDDTRIADIQQCATFFIEWQANILENTEINKKNKYRHLFTEQTLEDIRSALFGFLQLCHSALTLKIAIIPALINSDIIENLFCQQRGICNGLNTNPTLLQYGPALNAIILSQCTVSKKSNSGTKAHFFRAHVPGTLVKKQGRHPLRI